jgi:hypothetical protein
MATSQSVNSSAGVHIKYLRDFQKSISSFYLAFSFILIMDKVAVCPSIGNEW